MIHVAGATAEVERASAGATYGQAIRLSQCCPNGKRIPGAAALHWRPPRNVCRPDEVLDCA